MANEYKTAMSYVYSHEVNETVLNSVNSWLSRRSEARITHRWIGLLDGDLMLTLMYDEGGKNNAENERIIAFDGNRIRENVARKRNQQKDSIDAEEIASLVLRAANNWLGKHPRVNLTHRFTTMMGQDMLVILMYTGEEADSE